MLASVQCAYLLVAGSDVREPMRVIEPLVLSPSEDFAALASRLVHRMPWSVRLMLDGGWAGRTRAARS